MGRSQGAVIFWGLVSAFFATAFCYYYVKGLSSDENARTLQDQVMSLQSERDSLSSERDKIQAAAAETDKQLKTREDFLQDKETKLAEEESRIESMGMQSQTKSQQNQAQAAGVKKFDDTVRKLVAKTQDADVVVRGGRPVLRVPSSVFFAFGDTQLKPEGKAMLNQIAQSLNGDEDNFEVRIDTFTDSDGETANADAPKPDAGPGDKVFVDMTPGAKKPDATAKTPPVPSTKNHDTTSWNLTAERAAAITHYLHDQGTLPFQNLIVMGRADSSPIFPNSKEGHARNRRLEITITPLPAFFRAPDAAKVTPTKSAGKSTDLLTPPPDATAPSP